MYKLTQTTYNALITLGLEGKNDIKVFDSSEKGFVIGLGMTKDEAIRAGILEEVAPNILYHLSSTNNCIPHEWIKKNLSEDQYHSFLCFME